MRISPGPPRLMRRHGFTLVELMIATVPAAVLALVIGSMLVFSMRGWSRQQGWIDLQEDLATAQFALEHRLREASFHGTGITSNSITFSHTNGNARLYRDNANLWLDPNLGQAGDELLVVAGRLTRFQPTLTPGGAYVQLKLTEGSHYADTTLYIHFRN